MKDDTPARARRAEPQPDPILDTSGDSAEPAFSWMTGGTDTGGPATDDAHEPVSAESASTHSGSTHSGSTVEPAGFADAHRGTPSRGGVDAHGSTVSAGTSAQGAGRVEQPESRADRKAAEAAVEEPEASSSRESSPVFREQLPTSALQVRPPQEEVERRNAQRESAANAKPVAPRVMQVLLAIFFPLVLLILAVRAVTSPLFLWVEYNRPGFPGDGYGFSTDDRMTYGSYAVDYLSNWAGPRYLGDLVHRSGDKLFKDGEVSHMADVKLVILSTFGAGVLLVLFSLIAILYLRRRSSGGVRRGLFAGSLITLVLILGLGTLAVLGWQQFFTEFHRIFFAEGSWTFSMDDTLIRLFPGQFWIDAGMVIGGLVVLTALVTLILTWPTRRRRGLVAEKTTAAAGKSADQS
ncbi:integral membrane protein (TIGR01906 family) [Pseudarthrobacter sp. W1I19]|uniref:TIGR01906 family membrane protein n=1 Tax=Pseudarthrobacter sp. W1I19 TaxID=3042288 RepID=UPI00278ADD7A|nr:TIGR01906 family membrane protein [Pseudarthrobacter sp. W1I19]MDQ0924344.1 integral membrane protein (TIGR01906 family) [Pseudarthrobacter sp. W1I19]